LKDQLVIIGGHYDSWHSVPALQTMLPQRGNGGAMRILKAVGYKPKRTIRICLWSGEEQGLLGFKWICEKSFGDAQL